MKTLSLGVQDVPYPDLSSSGKTHRFITTGEVAEILEDKYQIMETFIDEHLDDVLEKMKDNLELKLNNYIGRNIDDEITFDIEVKFRDFILNKEMDRLGVKGVPTKAALEGRKTAKRIWQGPERPSFYDTELYLDSFSAEIE